MVHFVDKYLDPEAGGHEHQHEDDTATSKTEKIKGFSATFDSLKNMIESFSKKDAVATDILSRVQKGELADVKNVGQLDKKNAVFALRKVQFEKLFQQNTPVYLDSAQDTEVNVEAKQKYLDTLQQLFEGSASVSPDTHTGAVYAEIQQILVANKSLLPTEYQVHIGEKVGRKIVGEGKVGDGSVAQEGQEGSIEGLEKGYVYPVENAAYIKVMRDLQPGHTGIDIAAPEGTAVKAYVSGEVIAVHDGCENGAQQCGGGYGNRIEIRGVDGKIYTYNHLVNGSINVQKGDTVSSGKQIAKVGTTGHSTGPHLHFEISDGGKFISPSQHFAANIKSTTQSA